MKQPVKKIKFINAVFVASLLFLFAPVFSYAQAANFSGNWRLNNDKTVLGDIPAAAASTTLKVEQQDAKIVIERIGVNNTTESVPLNGASVELKFDWGKKTASIHFSDGGNIMQEDAIYAYNPDANMVYPVKATELWQLSDEKTLTISRTVELADGSKYSIKMVFDKQ